MQEEVIWEGAVQSQNCTKWVAMALRPTSSLSQQVDMLAYLFFFESCFCMCKNWREEKERGHDGNYFFGMSFIL